MKLRNVHYIIIFCIAFFSNLLFGEIPHQLLDLEKQLDLTEQQTLDNQIKDNHRLYQIKKRLNDYRQLVHLYRNEIRPDIEQVKANLKAIPKNTHNGLLKQRQEKYQTLYASIMSNWHYCDFMNKKINYLDGRLERQIEINTLASLALKNPNIIEIFQNFFQKPIRSVWSQFFLKDPMERFNKLRRTTFQNLYYVCLLVFSLWLTQMFFPNLKYLKKVNMSRVVVLMGFVLICNPFIFQYLKQHFTNGVDVISTVAARSRLKFIYLFSMYTFLNVVFKKINRKDIIHLLVLFFLYIFIFRAMGLIDGLNRLVEDRFYLYFTEVMVISLWYLFFIYFIHIFYEKLKKHIRPKRRVKLVWIFSFFVLINLSLAFIGYMNFAFWLIINTLMSAIALASIFGYYRIISATIDLFYDDKNILGRTVKKVIHIKPGQNIIELSFVKYTVMITGFIRISMYITTIWTSSPRLFKFLVDLFYQPIVLFGYSIKLSALMQAFSLFAFLIFLSRIIAFYLVELFYRDLTVQDHMEKIFFTIFVLLSGILCLAIAGFSFDRIMIIAGAFTVGIGFGLRGFVGNFISGLTLLFYHPISKGDQISVNGVSGRVKKINLMGTVLENEDHIDVIIPNSDILSRTLINFSLSNDKHNPFFIHLKFSVPDIKQLDRAKKLILDCAESHPDIVCNEKIKPEVLLLASETNAAIFQLDLICSPKHFDDVKKIKSELNESIIKALINKKLI